LARSHRLQAVQNPAGKVTVTGLRFERIGKNRHYKYNVVFHMGNSYVPVTDEIVQEPKAQCLLPAERFLELLIDRGGAPPTSKNKSAQN